MMIRHMICFMNAETKIAKLIMESIQSKHPVAVFARFQMLYAI